MTLGRTRAVGLLGLRGFLVDVEVDVSSGLPAFQVSGNPDRACAQSSDRVRAAATNSEHPLAQRRVTVNLSPASVPKCGSGFDLAICVAALVASGTVDQQVVAEVVHIGELGLDGSVRPVRGVMPLVLEAARAGVRHVVVPVANAAEARLVTGVAVHPVAHLSELVHRYEVLKVGGRPRPVDEPLGAVQHEVVAPDLVDVTGQLEGRHALEVAAAGVITSTSWARRARARRCWPSDCPGCSRCSTTSRRWRSRRWRPCSVRSGPRRGCSAGRRSWRRTTGPR